MFFTELQILKDSSSYPFLSSLFYILSPYVSLYTCWRFSKKASCPSSSATFTFSTIQCDSELAELFYVEILLEDLLERHFVFDEAFEHLSSSFVSFNHEYTFLKKLKIISSTPMSHSLILLICSCSIDIACIHYMLLQLASGCH